MFWDLRPPKIPNNARVPLGTRALLKEFLAGVNPKTNAEQEVFITIIKTGYFVGKKISFYFSEVNLNKGAAILECVQTATVAMRRSSIFVFCAVLCTRKIRNSPIC